jgi:hypothetical protein
MSGMRRGRFVLIAVAILAALGGTVLWALFASTSLTSAYMDRVHDGMTRAEVAETLGRRSDWRLDNLPDPPTADFWDASDGVIVVAYAPDGGSVSCTFHAESVSDRLWRRLFALFGRR